MYAAELFMLPKVDGTSGPAVSPPQIPPYTDKNNLCITRPRLH